jgi:hypothetical protein
VVVEGVEITVLEMDGHRIAKVRVSMGESEDTDEPSGPVETSAPVDVPERESRESQSRAQDQGGS